MLNYETMENSIQKSVEVDPNNLDREDEDDDSLFGSLRGFLIFGRLFGLLPYKGVFSKSSVNLKFRWFSVPTFISITILFILVFNTTLEVLRSVSASKKNAYALAQSVRSTLYYIWGTFIYVNFIVRASSFLGVFKAWRSCSVFFKKPDLQLKRDVIIISSVILISGTLENSLLYAGYIQKFLSSEDDDTKSKTLESYYINSHQSWARYIPYNPFLPVLAFVQHKFILLCWNYMDILIALLGRALYFKFRSLCESAEETLVKPLQERSPLANNLKALQVPDSKGWIQMTKDHRALCKLLQAFQNFLSPLIFVSYMVNIYYICMQLLDGLTMTVDLDTTTWVDVVNRPWSFLHLVMRIYVLSICCARVNMYAHQISTVIYDCPADCYNSDVSRLDKRVSGSREIGLTGLGTFTITKPYILSFIGVIFTFEIVLLQVVPDSGTGEGQKCCCE